VIDYRGFFVNDEDQLTGWAPAKPEDHTNIDPAVMDKVYETILRLKGNMVVPSTALPRRSADQGGQRARVDRQPASRHTRRHERRPLARACAL
jgi:hypothetical protein